MGIKGHRYETAMRRGITIATVVLALTSSASAREHYVQKWQQISDQLFLDTNSIAHTADGGVYANAFFGAAGTAEVDSFQHLLFDCQGRYKNASSFGSPVLPAAPGTAIGELASAACEAPNGPADRVAAAVTQPQYCRGFGENDCRYIQEFVENDVEPDWCEGAVTRQLSAREVRICTAMGVVREAR